ncbi:MAG: DUF5522 domain-containing protein [Bacteroidia bacterium]|nr:DUF5522 domain-containing protein [Bacteroidia bacterium]MDW8302411.1 DUF5522 domain-containing protein [Bacteroidia bacterium]
MNTSLEPEDYYINEQGYIVFTEKYHLKRGYCCLNGCKHCPYGFNKKVKAKTTHSSPNKNEKK